MSERLFENIGLLYKLNGIKNTKKRQEALKYADRELIICLIECISAILKHQVNLNSEELGELRQHKDVLRELATTRSEQQARKLLVQEGSGFLPIILPPLLSLGAALLADLVK